jgi:arginase family enzyme
MFLEQLKEGDLVILGYADDRGVERNGGRTGAAEGPDEIRDQLYRLTLKPGAQLKSQIWDLGNFQSWGLGLLEAHEKARETIRRIRAKKARLITLGGGHDWAFPDFVDFQSDFGSSAYLLNVDAHLDMRPEPTQVQNQGHSGTPFRRILSHGPLRMGVLGVQGSCTALAHWRWAEGARVTLLPLEELLLEASQAWEQIRNRFSLDPQNMSFGLSIDMDAFAQSQSPGVSAPQAFGVDPRLIAQLMGYMAPSLRHLGVYELCPRHDRDHSSARLAARLIQIYLSALTI